MEWIFILLGAVLVIGGYYLIVWPIFALLIVAIKKYDSNFIKGYLVHAGISLALSGLASLTIHPGLPIFVFFVILAYCYIYFAFQYLCYSLFGSPLIGQPQWIINFCGKNIFPIKAITIGERFRSFQFQTFFVSITTAIATSGIASIILVILSLFIKIKLPNIKF